jgi:hypothetical protein
MSLVAMELSSYRGKVDWASIRVFNLLYCIVSLFPLILADSRFIRFISLVFNIGEKIT